MNTNNMKTVFFAINARRLEDLKQNPSDKKIEFYLIEKIIELHKIDYENFTTDLLVERSFIEENKNYCFIDNTGIWHCILVKRAGKSEGVLIQSDGLNFPKYAAFYKWQ